MYVSRAKTEKQILIFSQSDLQLRITFDRLKNYPLPDQSTTSMSEKPTTSIDQSNVSNANLVSAFFKNAVSQVRDHYCFTKKGKWTGTTWNEVADSIKRLSGALVAAGVQPRDRVMICAENRPEWAIADLAIMAIGAIVVPAYTTNTEDDHVYIMEHSGAVVIITSGGILGNRVALAASRVPNIRMLITMDPDTELPHLAPTTIHTWQSLLKSTEPLVDINARI